MTVDTHDEHIGTGEWMHTWVSMNASGLISGHTKTWCTKWLAGFHGSTLPLLLDGNNKVIWPSNPDDVKHRFAVDGTWTTLPSERTDYWTNQADPNVLTQAKSLACVQWLDPKNMLLADIGLVGKVAGEVVSIIKAL